MTEYSNDSLEEYTVVVGNEETETLYAMNFMAEDEDHAREQATEVSEDGTPAYLDVEGGEKVTMIFPPKDLTTSE